MRFFVVNTDESTGRGVHWLAAMDVDGRRYFNDSLGMIGASQRRQLERLHPCLFVISKNETSFNFFLKLVRESESAGLLG